MAVWWLARDDGREQAGADPAVVAGGSGAEPLSRASALGLCLLPDEVRERYADDLGQGYGLCEFDVTLT